jgi:hypothetical protein
VACKPPKKGLKKIKKEKGKNPKFPVDKSKNQTSTKLKSCQKSQPDTVSNDKALKSPHKAGFFLANVLS